MSSLNAKQNREEREAAKVAKNPVPPLNPKFPYRMTPVDLEFFDLMKPPPIDTQKKP